MAKRRNKLLTRRELAETMDVKVRQVHRWEGDGCPVAKRGRRGVASLYDLEAVRTWHQAREAVDHDGPIDLAKERSRKERAQALLAEQLYQQRAGELVDATEVARVWSRHVSAVRTKLLSVPGVWADRVHRAARAGVAAVERVLDDAIRDVLTEVADKSDDELETAPSTRSRRKRA